MKPTTKRFIYIALFTVLGIVLQMLIHVAIEEWYIGLLTSNFDRFGLGLSWSTWFTIHMVWTVVLAIAGLVFGFLVGRYAWPLLYDAKGHVRTSLRWKK